MSEADLSGTYAVGVDARGRVAVVVGLAGSPSPLWADLLLAHDRPPSIVGLTPKRADGATDFPPTQIEILVARADLIADALDWLDVTIRATNAEHQTQSRRLADIYNEANTATEAWFSSRRPTDTCGAERPRRPTLN